MRALVPLLLLALAAPGAAAVGAPALPVAGDVSLAELAEALPSAGAVDAPAVVVEPPRVAVVQPLPLLQAPPLAAEATRDAPAPTPADVAAIEAEVWPAIPAPPALPPEPYLFPRDELLPVAAPALPPMAALPPLASPEPAPALVPAPRADDLVAPAAVATLAGVAFLAAGLYVRLAPSEVLESPTRRRVFDAVRGDPGLTVHTVARALGIDYKTAQHHLRVLRRGGFVGARRAGKLERYFVAGDLPPEGQEAALALRAPSAKALAGALAQRGRARASDLARSLAISEATASVQLRRLEAAGLATRGSDGLWAVAA